MLQFVEAALDAVAFAVENFVMANGSLAAGVRWNNGLHAGGLDRVADGVAIVGFISNERFAFDAL